MKQKVVVAGHLCLDITPAFPTRAFPLQAGETIQDVFAPGKLINVGEAHIHTGGAVANTGLAMKLLGMDVTLAGKIGEDSLGGIVASIFGQYGAADELIRCSDGSTSYTVVLAPPGIDRFFLHHPGANDTFCAEDIPDELLSEAALLHFGYPSLLRRMYENDGEELERLFQRAKGAGAAVSLDLAMADPESPAGRADWERILSRALALTDIFVPSAEELMFMLDRQKYAALRERAKEKDFCELLDLRRDIIPLADRCLAMGAKLVLIKCGAPGMFLKTASARRLRELPKRLGLDAEVWSETAIFEKSYVPERVLSGTGAGDTSIAAFLAAALRGLPPEECVRLAAAEGACCVAAYDAVSGLKTLEELQEKIAAGWKKVSGRK